ncbi:hypothetical protein Dimus_021880 [Dionaea muscipula]
MSRHPSVKWAQRPDKIFLTIELPDAKDVKVQLEPEGKFIFSATKDGIPYLVELELFDKIDLEGSKDSIGLRRIIYSIKKAERKWWSRVLKQEGKPPAFLQVDWDKWVDEDDESGRGVPGFGDLDFSNISLDGADDFDMDEPADDEEDRGESGDYDEASAASADKEEANTKNQGLSAAVQ